MFSEKDIVVDFWKEGTKLSAFFLLKHLKSCPVRSLYHEEYDGPFSFSFCIDFPGTLVLNHARSVAEANHYYPKAACLFSF